MRSISRLRNGVLVWLCLACPVAGQELPKFQWEQTETAENAPTRFELRLGEGDWFWAGVPSVVNSNGAVKTYALALPANLTPGKHMAILRACNDSGCTQSEALAFTIDSEPEPQPDPEPEPEPQPYPVPDMAALLVRVAMLEAAVEKLSTLTQQQASAISLADLRLTTLERRLDTTLQYLAETRSGGNVQQLQLYLQRIPR